MPDPHAPDLTLRRIYDHAEERAGYRVLVDRLWPRGVSKAAAALDEWAKDAAPSADLRRWYGHVPERFEEFALRYHRELDEPPAADAAAHLVELARTRPVVLLTATRDLERSGGRVLLDHLLDHPTGPG